MVLDALGTNGFDSLSGGTCDKVAVIAAVLVCGQSVFFSTACPLLRSFCSSDSLI